MRTILKWLAAPLLLAAAAATLWLYARHEARADPVARRLQVQVHGWPAGAPPVTVALLSDIHIGSGAMDPARLARIVDQVNARHPDLVLLAGDFVYGVDARFAAGLTGPLSRLRAPLGVIAVPGNHDHFAGLAAVRKALAAAGVTVLANQAVRRGPLQILAIDDAFSEHDDVPATLRAARGLGGVPLAVTHAPELVRKLPARVPLLLAGHTHCGQVVLPLLGAPAEWRREPGLYDPRYRCGPVREGGHLTLVTAGLGTSGAPVRLGAPPDFWLVTLGPAPR